MDESPWGPHATTPHASAHAATHRALHILNLRFERCLRGGLREPSPRTADVPTLLDLAAGTDKRLGFAAIEAISALPAAQITADVKPAMVAVLARGDWELTVGVSDVAAAFDWTDFAARLSTDTRSSPGTPR